MNNLIYKIQEAFLENKREIYEAIGKDYKENQMKIEYGLLEEMLNECNISSDSDENKTILVVYNGNVYKMLEIVLKGITNNNNIILITEEKSSYARDIILSIIRDILDKNSTNVIVKEYSETDPEVALEKNELIDRIVFLGDKRKYRQIKYNTNIETVYNGYGSIVVYVDDEDEFENELIKLEEIAYDNNLYVYKFIDNIDEAIEKINDDGKNYICIILSKDENKIKKFKENVNSTHILANEVNFDFKDELPIKLF